MAPSDDPRIELTVRLSDGSFDTTVTLPTQAPPADRDRVVGAWFKLIEAALTLVTHE